MIEYVYRSAIYGQLADFECGIPRMDEEIHSESIRKDIEKNGYEAYSVYGEKGEVIAFFAIGPDRFEAEEGAFEIAYLAVAKDRQHQGVGEACIREIIEIARKDGYRYLTVSALSITRPKNEKYEAVSFYRKCGFIQLEEQQSGIDIVPMWRPLKQLQAAEDDVKIKSDHNQ